MKELSQISIEVSEAGVERVVVGCDTAAEQRNAHLLLARVAPQLRQLDTALRADEEAK